jgi:NAD(P)-dependent dehydrogenase (short-subunit alcohol dehydrogenase family)
MTEPQLGDKVVLITRANHSIGAATAKAFAVEGAAAVVHFL